MVSGRQKTDVGAGRARCRDSKGVYLHGKSRVTCCHLTQRIEYQPFPTRQTNNAVTMRITRSKRRLLHSRDGSYARRWDRRSSCDDIRLPLLPMFRPDRLRGFMILHQRYHTPHRDLFPQDPARPWVGQPLFLAPCTATGRASAKRSINAADCGTAHRAKRQRTTPKKRRATMTKHT